MAEEELEEKSAEQPEEQKEKKKSEAFILWDAPLITETVFMTILSVAFIAGCFVLYFCDFGLKADTLALIKPFCAPLLISGLSYLLFFSYRVLDMDDRKWLKALLNLVYLGLVAVILYFNWYNCERFFQHPGGEAIGSQVVRHILWANSVSCGVFFLLYYSILVYVREWSKPLDLVMTVFMMTFIPIFIIVGFAIASIGAVVTAITLPGKLIQKSVDNDLASRRSNGQSYTIRHASGYEETAYSSNGSDFYGSDGSYLGHKD